MHKSFGKGAVYPVFPVNAPVLFYIVCVCVLTVIITSLRVLDIIRLAWLTGPVGVPSRSFNCTGWPPVCQTVKLMKLRLVFTMSKLTHIRLSGLSLSCV